MDDLQRNKKTIYLNVKELATPYPRDYRKLWNALMGLYIACLLAVTKICKRTSFEINDLLWLMVSEESVSMVTWIH